MGAQSIGSKFTRWFGHGGGKGDDLSEALLPRGVARSGDRNLSLRLSHGSAQGVSPAKAMRLSGQVEAGFERRVPSSLLPDSPDPIDDKALATFVDQALTYDDDRNRYYLDATAVQEEVFRQVSSGDVDQAMRAAAKKALDTRDKRVMYALIPGASPGETTRRLDL